MFEYLSTLFSEPLAFFDQAIYRTLAVLIGLCCHEWGHAYVAYRCGDDTAKRAGRMTLNPLRHLDPIGTILMFFVGFGYAKPVPVNPYRFKGDRNRDDFLVSIAGITVNLILFTLFTYLAVLGSAFMWNADFVKFNGLSKVVSYEYNAVWSVIAGSARADFGAVIERAWLIPLVRLSAYTALVNLNLADWHAHRADSFRAGHFGQNHQLGGLSCAGAAACADSRDLGVKHVLRFPQAV